MLSEAVRQFQSHLRALNAEYLFTDVPTEDNLLFQALNLAGFRLIETRLTYHNDKIQQFENTNRYEVRQAIPADIQGLKSVASGMRNQYDRFHSDPTFDPALADNFLAKYVEAAANGYCDIVLVPNVPGLPVESFLTANVLDKQWEDLGCRVSKMILSAVSSTTNKGWYVNLISEMTYLLKERGATNIFMNTQSTNRQVFHTWEKMGYKLGCTNHIFAWTNIA